MSNVITWCEVSGSENGFISETAGERCYKVLFEPDSAMLTPWMLILQIWEKDGPTLEVLGYYANAEAAKDDAQIHLRYNGGAA